MRKIVEKILYSKLPESDPLRPAERIIKGTLLGMLGWVIIILLILLLTGCATGAKQTVQESLHAESGAGITIWKIPILGIGFWGHDSWWGSSTALVIVHRYDYQARPPALSYGTPPIPPGLPPAVDYQTFYSSAWDDPSLVIFKNDSYRKVRVEIDGQQPIVLAAYGATTDLHLGVGEHQVRLIIEKSTASHGVWEVVRFFPISIRPEGRSQIFYIYDY